MKYDSQLESIVSQKMTPRWRSRGEANIGDISQWELPESAGKKGKKIDGYGNKEIKGQK